MMFNIIAPPMLARDGSVGVVHIFGTDGLTIQPYFWDGGAPVPMNVFEGGVDQVLVFALSNDGTTAVGQFTDTDLGAGLFRWSESGGATYLEKLSETAAADDRIQDLSGDGAIVVGASFYSGHDASLPTPVYWDQAGDLHLLLQPGDASWAYGLANLVSGDGNVIYGLLTNSPNGTDSTSGTPENVTALVRWDDFQTATTPTYNELLPDNGVFDNTVYTWHAVATNWTGSVLVGGADVADGNGSSMIRPFQWTEDGFVELGVPDGFTSGFATLVSREGDVIAGTVTNDSGAHVVRWTGIDGATATDISLTSVVVDSDHAPGSTANFYEYATGMSDDGSIIVGNSGTGGFETLYGFGTTAFRWSEADGWQTIGEFLQGNGVDVDGWQFSSTGSSSPVLGLGTGGDQGISGDGSVIIGVGKIQTDVNTYEPMYWLARCEADDPCGVTTVDGLEASIASLGLAGETSNLYLEDLFGTASRSAGGTGPTGSAYAYGFYDTDPMAAAGLGLNLRLGEDDVGGVSVGRAGIVTPLAHGGEARMEATSLVGNFSLRPHDGFVLEAGLAAAWLSGTVDRGYLNGNDPAMSSGDADGTSWGARALVGWTFGDVLDGTALTPYVSYSYAHSQYDGWTETGGPFPAEIAAFDATTQILRVGAEAEHSFGNGIIASAGLAYVRRTTDAGNIAFVLPDIMSGDLAGQTGSSEWAEASIGVVVPVGDTATTSVNATGRLPVEGDPSAAVQASVNLAF